MSKEKMTTYSFSAKFNAKPFSSDYQHIRMMPLEKWNAESPEDISSVPWFVRPLYCFMDFVAKGLCE